MTIFVLEMQNPIFKETHKQLQVLTFYWKKHKMSVLFPHV